MEIPLRLPTAPQTPREIARVILHKARRGQNPRRIAKAFKVPVKKIHQHLDKLRKLDVLIKVQPIEKVYGSTMRKHGAKLSLIYDIEEWEQENNRYITNKLHEMIIKGELMPIDEKDEIASANAGFRESLTTHPMHGGTIIMAKKKKKPSTKAQQEQRTPEEIVKLRAGIQKHKDEKKLDNPGIAKALGIGVNNLAYHWGQMRKAAKVAKKAVAKPVAPIPAARPHTEASKPVAPPADLSDSAFQRVQGLVVKMKLAELRALRSLVVNEIQSIESRL